MPRKKKEKKTGRYVLGKEADLHQHIAALKQAQVEIKRLKQELRRSEERFHAIFEASPDSIYLKDRNLRFTAVNPAFVKQFGVPAKKVLGTTGRVFINKKTRVHLQEEEARVLGGEIIQREKASDFKGLSSINRVTKVPVRDDAGEIVGLCCIGQDITERTRTEELLRQERESLYAILDRTPYGVMVWSQDGKTLYVNSEFTVITGYTLAEIPTSRDWNKLAFAKKKQRGTTRTAREKDIAQRATNGVFRQKLGRVFTRIYSIVTKGGAIKDIEFRPTLLADGRTLLILSDITERKRAEETLRQNEEQLRMLIETTKVGVTAIDGEGRTTYANEQLCTMLGRSSHEIVGEPVLNFFDEENKKIFKMLIAGRKKWREKSSQCEISWVKKNGSRIHTILSLTPYVDVRHLQHGSLAIITDITERREIEEQLRQSEERFRSVVETMRVGMSAVDSNGILTYVNDQFCKMFGYSANEVIGHPTIEFQDEESRKRQENILAKRKKGLRDPTSYEITWVTKDGRKINTILTPTPYFSLAGEFTGGFAIFTDITERKQMEEKLRNSGELYRTLVDNIRLGINLINSDHTIIMVNAAQEKHFKKTGAQFVGEKCFRVFQKRDTVCPDCPAVQSMATKKPAEVETVGIRDDGSPFQVRIKTFPIFDQSGDVTSFIEVAEDITDRKQAEEALRKSEEKYRRVVDLSPDGVAIASKGRHLFANQSLAKIFGVSDAAELIGRPIMDFIHPDYRETVRKRITEQIKQGKAVPLIEEKMLRADGTTIYTEVAAASLNIEGEEAVLAVIRDITKRKRAEEALQQSEERFRRLVETMLVGLSAADRNGMLTYVNEQLCRMLGYTAEELLGRPVSQFMTEESRKLQDKMFAKRKKGVRETASYEIIWLTKNKDKVYTITSPTPRFDANGRFISSFAISTDITKRRQMEEALRESEERFRMLAANAPFGISIMSPDRRFEYFNPKFVEIFGYIKKDIPDKGTWFSKAYPNEVYRNMIAGLWERDREDGVKVGEQRPRIFTVRCKNGRDKIIDFRTVNLKGGGQYVTYEDITERSHAEKALRDNEEKYRSLVQFTEDPVYLVNKDLCYLFMNEKYLSRIGMPLDHVVGRYYAEFHSSEENREFSEHVAQVLKTGRFVQYEHQSRRDGRYFLRTLSPVRDADGHIETITVISKDITERKRVEKELTYMATHDSLTGLPNRMLFNDRLLLSLTQAHRRKKKLALMLLDLDYFKDVNDTLGHSVGDQLLRAVGNRLQRLLRKGDTVARVGGDEFLLLLPEITRVEDAITIAKKILAAFRKPCVFDDHELLISTSIGIAIYPDDSDDADTLLKHADIAMYGAKDKGRGTYQCMDPPSTKR